MIRRGESPDQHLGTSATGLVEMGSSALIGAADVESQQAVEDGGGVPLAHSYDPHNGSSVRRGTVL